MKRMRRGLIRVTVPVLMVLLLPLGGCDAFPDMKMEKKSPARSADRSGSTPSKGD